MALLTHAPGIRFELADAPPRAPEVRSDVAGFVGFAERGPLHRPVRVESWPQYQTLFGGTRPAAYLPLAVHAFFHNGGRTAYIVRVAVPEDDETETAWERRSAAARATIRVPGLPKPLRFVASSPGRWGNRLEIELVPEPPRYAGGERRPADTGNTRQRFGLRVRSAQRGTWRIIDCTLDPAHPRFLGRVLGTTPDPDDADAVEEVYARIPDLPIRLAFESKQMLADLTAEKLEEARLTQQVVRLRGGRDGLAAVSIEHLVGSGRVDAPPYGLEALRGVDEVALLAIPDAVAFPDEQFETWSPSTPGCEVLCLPATPTPRAPVTQGSKAGEPQVPPEWSVDSSRETVTTGLTAMAQSYGLTLEELLAANPAYRLWYDNPNELRALAIPLVIPEPAAERPRQWQEDESIAAATALVSFCEQRRDCVALLDPPAGVRTIPAIMQFRDRFDTSFAALYWPWLQVERYPDAPPPRGLIDVPPSGIVAGLTAFADRTIGPHRSPAGQTARGAVSANVVLDELEHARLNERDVNVFRERATRGVVLEGARSLSFGQGARDPWRYFSVRRTVLVLEELIEEATQRLVFESIGPRLWTDLKDLVMAMLRERWRRGWLAGQREQDAFYVICDETTNPPGSRDQGLVIAVIGLRLPPPIEWIVVRIGRSAVGAEILTVEQA